eukprot:TRINITY_DN3608_c0_g1_i21.p1 TRINITY_DN3608_c0_g1~~TRINITY_DN3608_c0_g1_i21.p1  ORF type:complete len:180 (+),score=31.47 TRINITY_DN3608_c0_g1_i21:231-770(+)
MVTEVVFCSRMLRLVSRLDQFNPNKLGKYLSSSIPFFKVNVVENIDDGCTWELFNKVSGTLIPATSLEGVYIRNKHTTGFLSVRSNEGWTPPGKLWTRDSKNQPASSFSWECFTIINQKHEESPAEENEHLKEQLRLAQLQIKQLQDEVGKQWYQRRVLFFFFFFYKTKFIKTRNSFRS